MISFAQTRAEFYLRKEIREKMRWFFDNDSAIKQIKECVENKSPTPEWIISELYITFDRAFRLARQDEPRPVGD